MSYYLVQLASVVLVEVEHDPKGEEVSYGRHFASTADFVKKLPSGTGT